ncbi:MAG TPA: quinolinate synthase, partial [Verrucomicrobiales bacterium]|nr:quinolinate synthase [Verrucomicrobiales bacterium]HCZ03733.1 quinolinate synthase [Verrucomicrobiales bacterium]
IATEAGMIHRLKKECPDKKFIPAPTDNCACNECKYMKMNTLEKLHACMLNKSPDVNMPKDTLDRARLPIKRMLEMSK